MIGSDARGRMAGHEAAKHLTTTLPVAEIEALAKQIHTTMSGDGYAHLEPRWLFVRGFVEEFKLAFVFRTLSL